MDKDQKWNDWSSVWTKAVAMAWADDAFKKELLGDPRAALRKRFGFEVPEEIDLAVNEGGCWDGSDFERGRHQVAMSLPPAPPEGVDKAVAVAKAANSCGSGTF